MASVDMAVNAAQEQAKKRVGIVALTLLVVSAMMGGGVFNLPQNMAQSASLGAILIAWVISALGIFFLARSFQILADVKPELKAGIYGYARTGFGRYVGFQIAWGYWLSAAFGNVAFAVLVMDSFNYFVPPYFKGGNSPEAILVASAILWIMNWLVLRGIRAVVALNVVATIAKLIPVLAFLFVVAISMKAGLWASDMWGTAVSHPLTHTHLGSVLDQVKSTMLVTLWVYIGIEGAVVMSEASDERTVSRATILGFAVVTTLYVLSSILPFGIMTQAQLSPLDPPAAAAIMDRLVGRWASDFINIGVIIANLACWLVWTILVAELPYAGARDKTYPNVFATTNQNGAPSVALWVSTACMQAMIILVYFATNAWNVMLSITGVMILPAYIGSSGYLWRLLATGEYPRTARFSKRSAWAYSILATVYGMWLVYAAGLSYLLAGAVFFALGNAIFFWARREHAAEENVFKSHELVAALLLLCVGVLGAWLLVGGHLPEVYRP